MKTFTIENESNNITLHATPQDAEALANTEHFQDEAGLAKLAASWPTPRLAEIWNTLPGATPVKKFTDRKTAVARIWKAIQNLGDSVMAELASDVPEQHTVAGPVADPTEGAAEMTVPEEAVVESEPLAPDTPLAPQTPDVAPPEAPAPNTATRAKKAPKPATEKASREGSKTSRVIELLKREGGVTLKELMTEMGWQSHTTRALMSAGGSLAKKHGLTVISTKGENGERTYSIKA